MYYNITKSVGLCIFRGAHRLIESGDIKAIEEELLKNPASIDIPGKYEYAFTPLFFAVASERIDIVKLLIDKGANVNIAYEDAQGQTPLMFTTLKGSAEMLKLLIDSKADLEAKDKLGHTALLYTCLDRPIKNRAEKIRLLVEAGANVNAQNAIKATVLHYACMYDYPAMTGIVKFLLENGADKTLKTHYRATPLDAAKDADRPNPEIVKLLEKP